MISILINIINLKCWWPIGKILFHLRSYFLLIGKTAERLTRMLIHDAYNLVVQKVNELRDSGIDVYTEHSFITANINQSAEYEITGELPEALWNYVTFRSVSDEQMQQIFDVREYLLKSGIYFDSATFIAAERPSPEWQLDWSFTLLDFEENANEQ